MFELTRNSEVPLVDQICERVMQLVRHGQLTPGTRLPSIRKLARQVSASPFTVVDAYDRMVARAVIESLAGPGFFVTPRRLSAPLVDIVAAGSGFLPENWLMESTPAAVLTRLARGRRAQAWLPCPPQGLTELREQVATRLLQHGIAASAANTEPTCAPIH